MDRSLRLLIAASAVLVVAASLVASTGFRPLPGPPSAGGSVPTNALVVYENGFSQVHRDLEVDVEGGNATLELPGGALVETLRLVGLDVVEIVSREASATLLPGDRIVVHAGGESVEGRVLSVGERLVVATGNGTRAFAPASVGSVELVDLAGPTPGTVQVRLRVNDSDGRHRVSMDFLLRGLSWHAVHDLETEAGLLRTWATITGSPGLDVASLTLVSGAPRLAFAGPDARFAFGNGVMDGASVAHNDWSAAPFDEYHEYALGRAIELPAGRDLRLLLATNHVDLAHETVVHAERYAGRTPVQHEWSFTNPSGEPLPAGPVSFYTEGRFIGQDALPYLPRGERAVLVSGAALDVQATITTACLDSGHDRVEIAVTNRKASAVDVHIVLRVEPKATIEEASPGAVRSSDGEEWRMHADPDGTAHVEATLALATGFVC